MKKYIILTIIAFLSVAVIAQRPSRRPTGEESDRKKNEVVTKPSAKDPRNDSRTRATRNNSGNSVIKNRENSRNEYSIRKSSDKPERPAINEESRNNRKTNTVRREIPDKKVENDSGTRGTTQTTTRNTEKNNYTIRRRDHSVTGTGTRENARRSYETERRQYHTPYRKRVHREVVQVIKPRPVEYRRIHYPYRAPRSVTVIWTPRMYREYLIMYPEYRYWYYPVGYRIYTISAYDAIYHIGEVRNVYGRVNNIWYSWETDEYFLYFGASYPYHDFSVIIPGRKARRFSHRPERFFEDRYIWVTGLISLYDGKPEMIIKKKNQIHLY